MPNALALAPVDETRIALPLPHGCSAHPLGLTLRAGLNEAELFSICRGLAKVGRAIDWWVGDALAYADPGDGSEKKVKRVAAGLYEMLAEITGRDQQTLRNWKWVCAAIPLSLRGDKLTMGHAKEIVGRVESQQYEFWISKAATENLPVAKLREQIRISQAIYAEELNDKGDVSILEIGCQFVRDYSVAAGEVKMTAPLKARMLSILQPVLSELTSERSTKTAPRLRA